MYGAVVDVSGDEPGQVQVTPGSRSFGMEVQRPVDLTQHHVREVRTGRLRAGQLQEPGAKRVADVPISLCGRNHSVMAGRLFCGHMSELAVAYPGEWRKSPLCCEGSRS